MVTWRQVRVEGLSIRIALEEVPLKHKVNVSMRYIARSLHLSSGKLNTLKFLNFVNFNIILKFFNRNGDGTEHVSHNNALSSKGGGNADSLSTQL